jgi:hypothetical protein
LPTLASVAEAHGHELHVTTYLRVLLIGTTRIILSLKPLVKPIWEGL